MFWSIIFHSSAIRVAPKNRTRLFGGRFGLTHGLHHPEGQGVPSVLVADEKHHLLPVGAFVYLFGAETLSLEYGDAYSAVILPREVFNGFGSIGGASANSSLIPTPKTSAIAGRRDTSGQESCRSHLDTACEVTPRRSARSSWVSPAARRRDAIFSPIWEKSYFIAEAFILSEAHLETVLRPHPLYYSIEDRGLASNL